MKMHAWLPRQGWFEVVDVVDYFYKEEPGGWYPYAKVVLFDGSAWDVSIDTQLFYNLQGDPHEEKPRPLHSRNSGSSGHRRHRGPSRRRVMYDIRNAEAAYQQATEPWRNSIHSPLYPHNTLREHQRAVAFIPELIEEIKRLQAEVKS